MSADSGFFYLKALENQGIDAYVPDSNIAAGHSDPANHRMRQKLRDPGDENGAEAIVTVRAVGYMAGPALQPVAQEPAT